LGRNPAAEVRIEQLASPLTEALGGEVGSLLQNVQGAMRLFVNEGDPTWRYNIAGRPLLGPLLGALFVIGLLLALWYAGKRKNELRFGAASFLAISWLFVGFLPLLITGPELSMTQGIGMQPVLYLFPALSLLAIGQVQIKDKKIADSGWIKGIVVLIFLATAVVTYRDYFLTWANAPEVRVQYETTVATALDYLNDEGEGIAVLSTITPDRYHSPAVARMILHNDQVEPRWFDARSSLLLPQMETGQVLIPGFTPMPAVLVPYFSTAELVKSLPMRETDLDRPVDIYQVNRAEMQRDWQRRLNTVDVVFDDAVELLGYARQTSAAAPGDEIDLVTLWRARKPVEGAVIFTHLLAPDGPPLAQADQTGVPGYAWQPGDLFLQAHRLKIADDTPPGRYPLAAGLYTQDDGLRLPLTRTDQSGDLYTFGSLVIEP
jgi:hypothetical protein